MWVDEALPFPSDHRPVIGDARGVFDPEARPPVRRALRAQHFRIRDQGVTGAYHAALTAARWGQGERPGDLEALYVGFQGPLPEVPRSTTRTARGRCGIWPSGSRRALTQPPRNGAPGWL